MERTALKADSFSAINKFPEGSLLCSPQLATASGPEPDDFSSHLAPDLLKVSFTDNTNIPALQYQSKLRLFFFN
jgi:hypothetical protein